MSYFTQRNERYFDERLWVPGRRIPNWFVVVCAFIIRPVIKLAFRYRAMHWERVEVLGDEPVVFACNHVSFADPAVTWCLLYSKRKPARFLARTSLFRPLVAGMGARAGAIPIEPESADKTAIRRAANCLKRGENMTIFPEGTRMNKPWKTYKPHGGIVLVARMGKARVVPCGIAGTEKIMPYGKAKFLRFPRVTVNFGEPIDVRDPRYNEIDKKERAEYIANDIMQRCFELRDEAAR